MQIVIDIPEEDYERLKVYEKAPFCSLTSRVYEAIANGTPFPEHHGALKDVDKLIPDMCETIGCGYQAVSCIQIDLAPTIIPATKEGE